MLLRKSQDFLKISATPGAEHFKICSPCAPAEARRSIFKLFAGKFCGKLERNFACLGTHKRKARLSFGEIFSAFFVRS